MSLDDKFRGVCGEDNCPGIGIWKDADNVYWCDRHNHSLVALVKPPGWSEQEFFLLKKSLSGETIVTNMRSGIHDNLIAWAVQMGKFVRVDRQSIWGNPYRIPTHGSRTTVILKYRTLYLPNKPDLISRISQLRGKVLGCWCAPEPCHADVLVGMIRTDQQQ